MILKGGGAIQTLYTSLSRGVNLIFFLSGSHVSTPWGGGALCVCPVAVKAQAGALVFEGTPTGQNHEARGWTSMALFRITSLSLTPKVSPQEEAARPNPGKRVLGGGLLFQAWVEVFRNHRLPPLPCQHL